MDRNSVSSLSFSESLIHIPGLHPICGVTIMQESIIFLTFMSGKYSQA